MTTVKRMTFDQAMTHIFAEHEKLLQALGVPQSDQVTNQLFALNELRLFMIKKKLRQQVALIYWLTALNFGVALWAVFQ